MLDKEVQAYLHSFIQQKEANSLLKKLEKIAQEENIPIMEPIGIETMLTILQIQQPKKILEIGTAIGYSALKMAYALPTTVIISLERDVNRYEQALEHIREAGFQERIIVLNGDALNIGSEVKAYGPFDAIFIDAAKGHYKKFFEQYSKYLTNDGCVYTDNVLFKGLVCKTDLEKKQKKGFIGKIKDYNEWLMHHDDFTTTIIPAGDGLAVSKKIR